ncbi:hypothetical protein JI58_03910 [Marinosulfonomonas sp. PRT-SC04]|nr:hypothetical protein JI58_03910 [Marinosulfonomonas sp. PRT-SC04]
MKRGHSMNERGIEQAEAVVELERETAIRRNRILVGTKGCADCEDCDAPISEARQRAAPFATRCIDCQQKHEREAKRYGA